MKRSAAAATLSTSSRCSTRTVTFAVSAAHDCRAQVCRALVLAGHDVLRLEPAERELENVFLELVGEGADARG